MSIVAVLVHRDVVFDLLMHLPINIGGVGCLLLFPFFGHQPKDDEDYKQNESHGRLVDEQANQVIDNFPQSVSVAYTYATVTSSRIAVGVTDVGGGVMDGLDANQAN